MYVKDDKTLEGTVGYLVHVEPTMIQLELVYSKAVYRRSQSKALDSLRS